MATTTYNGTGYRHAPAGVSGVKMETIDSASPEVKALIRQLNRLATASTLEEHSAALQGFDEDLTLDTPFIMVQGRERVRVLASLTKFFLGHFEIEPRLVKITVPEGGATKFGKLELDSIVHWLPHRPWFLPLTLLLPRDLPIFADVSLGVKAHNDKVFFVSGKNHNLPHVPRILRVLAGYVAGTAVSVIEPIYLNLLEWYRAGVENVNHGTHAIRDTAYRGTDYVKDTTVTVAQKVGDVLPNSITDKVAPIAERVGETVGIKTA